MEQLTLFRILVVSGAIGCTLFGLLYLFTPAFVHKLSEGINRSVLTLDTVLGRQPRLTGGFLLLVGIPLLYMVLFAF